MRRHDGRQKRRFPRELGSELVVKGLDGDVALGATTMFAESPTDLSRQPLGGERRYNRIDVAGSVANGECRLAFRGAAVNAQHGRHHQFDTGKLQILGAQILHLAPP